MAEEHKYPEIELQSAGTHGSGSSSGTYYKLEARLAYHSPQVIANDPHFPLILDLCWRTIPISEGATPWGINISVRAWDRDALRCGLIPYIAAEAHRWGFLAALEASNFGGTLCVETRLVAVEFRLSYETKEVGVLPAQKYRHRADGVSPRSVHTEPSTSLQE